MAAQVPPRKDLMNTMIFGATGRKILPPHTTATDHHTAARPRHGYAMLTTRELRRLVAAMVD